METFRRALRGFTLVEMMVAISVMMVLLAIAVPSFKDASLGSQLRSTANNIVASVQLARSEALKRNAVVTLCASSDGATCGAGPWHQGWIVASGATVLRYEQASPSGLRINASGGTASLSFQPIGVGATAVTFTVCRATPSIGNQERVVTVDATGRAWAKRTTTAVCS